MLNEMLTKQASQIKTAADQFRVLMGELDKLAFTPDPVRKVEGMDALLAVRDYNAPVYKRHRDKPGAVDELLAEKPLNTVSEVANLPSEAQEPPQPADHGDDSRKSATENKAMGEQGFTWDPKAPFPKSDPSMSQTNLGTTPGAGGTAKPQPNIGKSASRLQETIAKLASQGRIRTLEPGGQRRPFEDLTKEGRADPPGQKKKGKMPGWVRPALGLTGTAIGLGLGAHYLTRRAGQATARETFSRGADFGRAAREAADAARRASRERAAGFDFNFDFGRRRPGAGAGHTPPPGAGAGAGHTPPPGGKWGGGSRQAPPPPPPPQHKKDEAFRFFGVEPGDFEGAKKAYKKYMRKHHPDVAGGSRAKAAEGNEMFDRIKMGSVLIKMAFRLGII